MTVPLCVGWLRHELLQVEHPPSSIENFAFARTQEREPLNSMLLVGSWELPMLQSYRAKFVHASSQTHRLTSGIG